jgi:hypothetical protein
MIDNTVIQWKGLTFQQISAGIKFNKPTANKNFFTANPLKIYRKEIASSSLTNCSQRTSTKIDDFDRPGGVITTSISNRTGLANTMDINYENNVCQHPQESCDVILSPEANARRRVRSSGMIKRNFNTGANNDTYYTSTKQYLNSRNISFEQNQYFHVKYGNSTVKPGTNASIQNIYASNGINHCAKYKINQSTSFTYIWLDDLSYTVNVPAGSYDIDDLNQLLFNTMSENLHYYLQLPQLNKVYLLRFAYDNASNRIQLYATFSSSTVFDLINYSLPISNPVTWYDVSSNSNVSIDVSNSQLLTGLGFNSGIFPVSQDNVSNTIFTGPNTPSLLPPYVPIYYKPNNSQFGTQGAVSSSDLINRKKYDTITTVGSSFRSAYGEQTANALAYGSSQYGYTLKDKIGYPVKKTPTFASYSSEMRQCMSRKISTAN